MALCRMQKYFEIKKTRIFVENYELMNTFEYLNALDVCYK
jgi:hypothetical protein